MPYKEIADTLLKKAPILTQRMCIRPPDEKDISAYHNAMRDSKVELQRWMNWAKNWPNSNHIQTFFNESISHWESGHRHLRLNAHDIATQRDLICSIGITIDDIGKRELHISYWANSKFTGQGYTTEAVKAVLKTLFKNLHASQIITGHAKKNFASKRIIEKCGFIPHVDPREEFGYKMVSIEQIPD